MASRSVTITEEFGLYRVKCDGEYVGVTGRSAEDAIIRAYAMTEGASAKLEGAILEIRSSHDMGEVFEALLGKKGPDSGLVAAR